MADQVGSIEYEVAVNTASALKADKEIDKATKKIVDNFTKADKAIKLFEDRMFDMGRTINSQGQVINKNGEIVKAATRRYQDLTERVSSAASGLASLANTPARAVNTALAGTSRAAGQAGIQFQQFIGQIQGGQGFMLAFSQQAADLGIVLGAPLLGAITGISASIAGIFLPALFKGVEGIREFSESSKILRDDFDKLSESQKKILSASLVEEYKKQRREANELQKEINSVQTSLLAAQRAGGGFVNSLLVGDPEKLQAELTKLRASLSSLNLEMTETQGKIKDLSGAEAEAAEETKKVAEDLTRLIENTVILASTYGKTEREVAVYTATMLGATEAQIGQINATYDIVEAKKAEEKATKDAARAQTQSDRQRSVLARQTQSLGLSPLDALKQRQAQELTLLRQLVEQKLIIDSEYLERKQELERQHGEQIKQLNDKGRDEQILNYQAIQDQISGTFATVAIGMQDGEDAAKSLARTIITQVLGSLINTGIETVKNAGLTKALGATQVATIGSVTSAQTAATATTTAATVAAAGTTAVAAAPAAALTSTFSFGGAAVAGGIALLGTLALAKSASSGRQYGGPVSNGSLYEVGEAGPEIYSSGGRSYLLPDRNGNVLSNDELTGNKAGSGSKTVNLSLNLSPRTPQEFSDELYNNRDMITNIVEKSFNDRGRVF